MSLPSHYGYPYMGPVARNVEGHSKLAKEANAALFNVAFDFLQVVLSVPGDGFAIDIGTGAGWAAYLLCPFRHVIAVDVHRNLLGPICGWLGKGISPVVADGVCLPLPDDCADVVFMNSAFHHMGDYQAALDEWYRVLRPGGRLAATGEIPMASQEVLDGLLKHHREQGLPDDEGGFTVEQLGSFLAHSNFSEAKHIWMLYDDNMRDMNPDDLVVPKSKGVNGIILAIR